MTKLMTIVKNVDDLTSIRCRPVPTANGLPTDTKTFIKNMKNTMTAAGGVGLAAPQVGLFDQIIIVRTLEDGDLALINPKITGESEKLLNSPEGCLSLEGKMAANKRPAWTEMTYIDEAGDEVHRKFEGFESSIVQHEYEHLLCITMFAQHHFSRYLDYKMFRNRLANNDDDLHFHFVGNNVPNFFPLTEKLFRFGSAAELKFAINNPLHIRFRINELYAVDNAERGPLSY